MKRVVFVHEGKAHYPELQAYRHHLSPAFATDEMTQQEAARVAANGSTVLWYLMGFYPRRLEAAFIIHDYRSLSVRPGAILKDRMKRWFNHKPDIRIFLNANVRREMGFANDVPSLQIDMGVPTSVRRLRVLRNEYDYDFCYIGEISARRKCDQMLDSFCRRFGRDKRFVLVGRAEEAIVSRYGELENVEFTGRVDQEEALQYVSRSAVAVCYLPYDRPHCLQTPTKLLEYAALGKRILVNSSPSNIETATRLGIRVLDGGRDPFAVVSAPEEVPDNEDFDASAVEWPAVLERSGIRDRLVEALR